MQDELFSPTIRERDNSARPPWRPDSIFYPAFFGGPIAAAVLGLLNARRLGLTRGTLLAIAAAGAIGFATRVVLSATIDGNSALRLLGSVTGVLVALVVAAVERRPFRAYVFRGGDPASLVGPGLLAAIGCGLLEAVLIIGLVR
ncbi:hypothetical protein ACIA5D_39885 [Actinoplanes sp. NPDC051513]|uniref:hypothetical protein n=1 Tax=Actinoplanes sp. NPDC051513 TaxID=3363908 RepID=UPI003797A8F8